MLAGKGQRSASNSSESSSGSPLSPGGVSGQQQQQQQQPKGMMMGSPVKGAGGLMAESGRQLEIIEERHTESEAEVSDNEDNNDDQVEKMRREEISKR